MTSLSVSYTDLVFWKLSYGLKREYWGECACVYEHNGLIILRFVKKKMKILNVANVDLCIDNNPFPLAWCGLRLNQAMTT